MNDDEMKVHVESYIDLFSVEALLDRVAYVCHAKAQHMQEAWQDEAGAKVWTAQARSIEYAASTANRRGL